MRGAGLVRGCLLWVLFLSLPGRADALLIPFADPATQTMQSSTAEPGATAARTVDGSGLGAGFPAFPTTHTSLNTDGWLSEGNDISSAWVHYDFGVEQLLDAIRFWNYNDDSGCCIGRGLAQMAISTSNDSLAFGNSNHGSWTLLTALTSIPVGPADANVAYGAAFDLPNITTRFVMFDGFQIHNPGGNFSAAFGEVQFLAVPEPSSTTLFAASGLLVTWALRRRGKGA